MRLNNSNKTNYFKFISTSAVTLMILGVFAFLLEYFVFNALGVSQYLLLAVPFLILIIFWLRGRQLFEYDSDGEALIFKNRNVVSFIGKPHIDEFPKYKLQSYEIIDLGLLKRLYITIFSKKNNSLILRYDISYLSSKEVRDLKMSLSKVIKINSERKREQIN